MKQFQIWMLENDISNNDLAIILSTSKQNVSKKLRGKVSFTLLELNILRVHFKMSDSLFVQLFFEMLPIKRASERV